MNFYDRQTRTVVLDDENSVTVRKLAFGEQQEAMSASMSFEMTLDTEGKTRPSATGKLDPFRMKREELISAVVDWTGPGFAGRPVTRENILALPPEIIDAIRSAVDELNSEMSDDEKKASAASTNTPSS